jgi:hypothetical protein
MLKQPIWQRDGFDGDDYGAGDVLDVGVSNLS